MCIMQLVYYNSIIILIVCCKIVSKRWYVKINSRDKSNYLIAMLLNINCHSFNMNLHSIIRQFLFKLIVHYCTLIIINSSFKCSHYSMTKYLIELIQRNKALRDIIITRGRWNIKLSMLEPNMHYSPITQQQFLAETIWGLQRIVPKWYIYPILSCLVSVWYDC